MAIKDFSIVPAIVTITNVAERQKMYDAGSIQRAGVADIEVDARGRQFVYSDATATIQLYRVNNFVNIPSGDSVKLVAETSEELAYFMSLAGKDLTVVAEAITTEEEVENGEEEEEA